MCRESVTNGLKSVRVSFDYNLRSIQMNKRGLVIAITAAMALSAAAAQAGVEIYGKARVSLDYITNNDPNPAIKDSSVSLSCNVARLGFKGDVDLGNGLSALWQIVIGSVQRIRDLHFE